MLERGFVYLLFGLYFVIGIVIGSFLNVCIYRLPLGKSVISPPSACGSCGHRLGALDMIPVLSYFLLRGRCRYCNAAYSARYMLVELLTGILFALCGLYYLPGLKIILVFFFVACLIVQAFIDLDHQILLDEILMLMLPTGIKQRKDPIPFGPFLCIGAYIALLFSPYLIYFYWNLFV